MLIEINPIAFDNAFGAARSYPGMGDLKIIFNPYESTWKVEISFSDNTRYSSIENEDINEALDEVANLVHNYKRAHYDLL